MQNGYLCFWQRFEIEVHAETSYQAQQIAMEKFQKQTRKKVKQNEVAAVLCERPDGTQVVHTADF